jgi:hypothetical protein
VLILKDFFLLKVRKFAKMTFLGAGFIRLTPHPKGPPNGVDYAFASSEPTFSWLQSHTSERQKTAHMDGLFSLVGMDAQFTSLFQLLN